MGGLVTEKYLHMCTSTVTEATRIRIYRRLNPISLTVQRFKGKCSFEHVDNHTYETHNNQCPAINVP
jgi:hypothetical protein